MLRTINSSSILKAKDKSYFLNVSTTKFSKISPNSIQRYVNKGYTFDCANNVVGKLEDITKLESILSSQPLLVNSESLDENGNVKDKKCAAILNLMIKKNQENKIKQNPPANLFLLPEVLKNLVGVPIVKKNEPVRRKSKQTKTSLARSAHSGIARSRSANEVSARPEGLRPSAVAPLARTRTRAISSLAERKALAKARSAPPKTNKKSLICSPILRQI